MEFDARITIRKVQLKHRVGLAQGGGFPSGLGFQHGVVTFVVTDAWDFHRAVGLSLSKLGHFAIVLFHSHAFRKTEDGIIQAEVLWVQVEVSRRDFVRADLIRSNGFTPVLIREELGAGDTFIWGTVVRVGWWSSFKVTAAGLKAVARPTEGSWRTTPSIVRRERCGCNVSWVDSAGWTD
jgi:hypothetical protein